ncbi:hypothetical protein C4J86_0816 [Pseudomonas sp. R2-7-07]|nr:hypothetical protein C4J94_0811 [Pseudomonas sp. R5-89-07]AZF46069.1 hypothetical protein C4J86_0816 [Pseudomonas sp. R2-7-07]
MEVKQQRWQYLVPEPEHERLIRVYWDGPTARPGRASDDTSW